MTIGAVVVAAAIGIVFAIVFLAPRYQAWRAEQALSAKIQANPDAKEALGIIQKNEAAKAENAKSVAPYVNIGNQWVLIADLLHDQTARDKAIAEYETGMAVSTSTNSVLILNAGNAYKDSGRFAEAETKYRLAMRLDPGEPNGYIKLVELYRFNMDKPPQDVIAVFQKGLETLVDNTRLVQELADYLQTIGRYKSALEYYGLLAKRYPEQFAPIIAELQVKIAASGTAAE